MSGLFGGGSQDNSAAIAAQEAQAKQLDLQQKQLDAQEKRLEAEKAQEAQKLQAQMTAKRRGARALLSEERDDELGIPSTTLGGK